MAKNWAIIIGINKYSYLEHLKFAKTDAEAMHHWLLQEGGFDPKGLFLFTDDSDQIPTEPPIPTEPSFGHLDTFFDVQFERQLLTSADNLWFFFSGHGNRGLGGDYLMLSDSNPRRLEQTALSVSYITERLRNWGAGNVVMFIDACRNVENQARGGTITLQDYQGMIAFYSCRTKEKSLEVKSIKRGAFTHILLQALEETKRQNRCLTVAELEQYLMTEVPKLSPNQHPLARVEPTYKSNFVLFGEAQKSNIESLKNLAYRKVVEDKKEEARELLIHANIAAKGGDLDIINLLANLPSSSRVVKSKSIEPLDLLTDKFETVTFDYRGEIIGRKSRTARYYTQDLGKGITLEMVAIPGGTFLMGTEDEEIERLVKKFNWEGFRRERPQHEVTVPPFFMGKYPITQAQWKAIASRTDLKVKQDLDFNPAYFKDRPDSDRRPVEQVNWYDAIEFCARLSKLTVREYRLPSEAEWEYACRAGTTTPFYFGETITGELANYRSSETYADEYKGEYRQQTTPVGQFPPNAFGLYDMHGNVWEWCADTWHDNYDGAPTDGSAWIENGDDNRSPPRCGSWYSNPSLCRSASRLNGFRRDLFYYLGFRVVCGAGRTL
ncbi:MAG: SUMF1/EgtB/PvdO family nonheme iron enzyme [Dolichospermum sp.]|jgi:formylglycine-generating enzyme required for sulfatase activity|uniref:SUMF1/EgtB/PvdO family nonheme iron enzyme n=1 Tax=unclassified Microcystis TaxID=2643300 RepID=UPI00258FBEFA|nr:MULTISPECIES: SUMF1/EgtB/PvdO family nonheme iron enzyme [unclassified Microcystis]MCA6604201.1 SUMF1/EgtB/PvdO family nonheme iron enzyme [Pseudanabaena sp. M007S1SP1A06QC]MCA2668663.1 SUMF1/EgtB/PvdO family nonheme iron enzyme [Microcystis sp. M045S2]MCA2802850.1 SUMF1/EgtB/PvdO family nonheme iron enzyme [Microcystis sp. M114S2]MCA2836432.1 SUMF1/EgtB/PvdO family nonheme iron enzyme [Microcystis sp. M078S1]MCA2847820.1 SUMF1/EgtB/PvdO family nonheme iron enzyme [Microcystis sp. M074S1]